MNKFHINHIEYSQQEFLDISSEELKKQDISEWERDFYHFVLDWFSQTECVSIFTSGSTGKPKEIKLAKSDIIKSARRSVAFFDLKLGENALLCLSVKYIAGMLMVVRALEGKLNLITVSPHQIKIVNEEIHFAALVPLQLEKLIHKPEQLNRIKKMLLGGAPLSSSLAGKLQNIYHGTAWETYGMTETITHVAVRKIGQDALGEFHGLPGISFSTDERECLIIRDHLIHPEPIVTNDRVELFSSDHFRLLGRADNIINSGGVKVQPEELEAFLASYISGKFCISSVPHEELGNQVVLVIEKGVDTHRLHEGLEAIQPYKRPRRIIEIPVLPLTVSGKTDYNRIRDFLANNITKSTEGDL